MSAPALRPVVLMVASSGLLTVNDAMVKWLAQGYPVGQVIAVRGTLVVALVLAWAVATRRTNTRKSPRHDSAIAAGNRSSAHSTTAVQNEEEEEDEEVSFWF